VEAPVLHDHSVIGVLADGRKGMPSDPRYQQEQEQRRRPRGASAAVTRQVHVSSLAARHGRGQGAGLSDCSDVTTVHPGVIGRSRSNLSPDSAEMLDPEGIPNPGVLF